MLEMTGTHSARILKPELKVSLWWKIKNLPNIARAWRLPIARLFGIPMMYGRLKIRVFHHDGSVVNYGTVSYRVVTDAFINELVDQLQAEDSTWGDFKWHDSGIGTTAEAAGDTTIETSDGESRVSGSQVEGATSKIYKSVGTISYTTTKAITEHGLFNASTGGELMDRSVFSAINVVNGTAIEHSYELSVTGS